MAAGSGPNPLGSDKFCLKWNDFESNVSTVFQELREDGDFFDVTLACDGQQMEAHKVILSACSPFFRGVLKRNPHAHPLLYLKDIKHEDMEAVLDFMYHGEVNIAQTQLSTFLQVARELQVKGLTKYGPETSPGAAAAKTPAKRAQQQRRNRKVRQHSSEKEEVVFQQEEVELLQGRVKTEGLEMEVEGGVEEGWMEEHQKTSYQDTYYQEEMAQALADGSIGNDRNVLLKYIKKVADMERIGEDQYKCEICNKMGSRKAHVLNHVESTHFPYTFDYSCDICKKKMKTKKSLENHVYHNHKDGQTDIIVETQNVN